jgi:hypothetical protein
MKRVIFLRPAGEGGLLAGRVPRNLGLQKARIPFPSHAVSCNIQPKVLGVVQGGTMRSLDISPRFRANAEVVLYSGDTLDLLSSLPSELVSLVVTSPPYNLGKPYEKRLKIQDYVDEQR